MHPYRTSALQTAAPYQHTWWMKLVRRWQRYILARHPYYRHLAARFMRKALVEKNPSCTWHVWMNEVCPNAWDYGLLEDGAYLRSDIRRNLRSSRRTLIRLGVWRGP